MSIKSITTLLFICLICACTTNSTKTGSPKPFSSLFGHSQVCRIGDTCDYTGYFDKYSSSDLNIGDALYTYDDNGQCILIVANKSDLDKTESLNSGELSVKGEAIARSKLDYWSKSSFCRDYNWVLNLESVDPVLVIYH